MLATALCLVSSDDQPRLKEILLAVGFSMKCTCYAWLLSSLFTKMYYALDCWHVSLEMILISSDNAFWVCFLLFSKVTKALTNNFKHNKRNRQNVKIPGRK
jgi:hypothetical protein